MTRNCRGITVLELLVAITAIALLAAILAPAVMQVRETSRRTTCQSRLHNIGAALQAYESAHQYYPSAQEYDPTTSSKTSDRSFAPHVELLPHVDQTPLYDRINSTAPFGTLGGQLAALVLGLPDEPITKLALTSVPVFLCPSDPQPGGNSYRACIGPGPYYWETSLSPGGGTGPFTLGARYTAVDFADGLSMTVAFSEKKKSGPGMEWDPETDFWYTRYSDLGGPHLNVDGMVGLCEGLVGTPPEYHDRAGMTWMFTAFAYTWYNHAVTPNAEAVDCTRDPGGPDYLAHSGAGAYRASSYHSGGVNCVFMDGSTRFVADPIDLGVWRALSTRADGERISSGTF